MRAIARLLGTLVFLLLSVASAYAGTLTLAWDPVSDPRLAGYKVYYGTSSGNYTGQIDVGNVTTRTVSNLTDGATYYFAVSAYDASRVESGFSNEVVGTVPAAAPVANFTASTTTGTAPVSLNFTSTSTGSITSYTWTFGDGTTSSAQNPAKTYSSAGSYTVSLKVTGPGGSNTKSVPNYITVTAPADTSAPTAPGGLTASPSGATTVNLSWTASTDNVGVAGYRVERCTGASCTSFSQIATPAGTTYSDTGRTASTIYRYRVRAADAAGNLGAYSAIATATTPTAPDTTAPSVPSGVTATATSATSVSLSWAASTDNVGVTGYRVERCTGASCTSFSQIATPTGTTYSDTGRTASTTYGYRVRAADAAGNLSSYSAIVNATTPAAVLPSGTNHALASNGGIASASSTYGGAYGVAGVNNGERAGVGWGTGSGGWRDSTPGQWPDWVQIDFSGSRTIDRVVVYSLKDDLADPTEPTDSLRSTLYGLRDFAVQSWNGTSWITLATVTGNDLVKRTVTFPAIATSRIRINVTSALTEASQIVEIEAWGQ